MPAGNITAVERIHKLNSIKELLDQGKTVDQIVEDIGMSKRAVMRNIKYLQDLGTSDLTSEEIAERRKELYIELLEAGAEARALFDKYKELENKTVDTKRFFNSWLDTITMRQKLYGLDSIKLENLTQIQVNQYQVPDKIDSVTGERIAKLIKDSHESKIKQIL